MPKAAAVDERGRKSRATIASVRRPLPRVPDGGCLFAIAAAGAQEKPPAFEVASENANPGGDGSFSIDVAPSGRLNIRNMNVRILIREAYHLRENQIAGGPSWVNTQGFDIQGKPPGEQPVPSQRVFQMLGTLLEERFQLKSHRETREQPGYELVADSRGASLRLPARAGRR